MKLHIRKDPEINIVRKDMILFGRGDGSKHVGVTHASIGNFDSTPYEPRYQEWGYSAELHEHDGKLWVYLIEYERTTIIQDGDWVHDEEEDPSLYVSEDQGATWSRHPDATHPHLDDTTRLDRVASG